MSDLYNENDEIEIDDNDYEDVCFICRRPERKAGRMFKLPPNICVCDDCMHKTMDAMNQMDLQGMMNDPAFQKELENFNRYGGMYGFPGMNGMPNMNGFSGMTQDASNKNTADKADEKAVEDQKATNEEAQDNKDQKDDGAKTEDSAEATDAKKNNNPKSTVSFGGMNGFPGFGGFPGGGFPNISFVNVSDLPGGNIPNKQRLKKKKKREEGQPVLNIKDIPAPHKIKASLDEYVVGQEHAKKVISVAVYNHYKRVATDTMDEIEIEKSNMLMIGPTGSGKTYLVKTLARLLDVPLAIADATSLTEAGYIGDDIESVVSKLLAAADNDVEKAERGIIFIDEIDKIAKKKNTNSRDVSGESVQQGMLKLLEGAEIEVPVGANSKNAMVPLATVNTRNILFICGGAFPDLEEIIKERLNKTNSIGFNSELKDKYDKDKTILSKVTVEDIRKFGMIPEFIGRLPVIYTLEGLSKEMLVKILKEPKNAILKQYQKLLELDEVKLDFTEGALEAIAEKAMERDTGARALRSIIEEFMLDIMYEIPKDDNIGQVTITREYIEGNGGPIIDIRSNQITTSMDELKEVPVE